MSRLSTNDEGDNEMISGLCTDHLGFTLRKISDRISYVGGFTISHCPKWNSLYPNEVGRIAQQVWEGKDQSPIGNDPQNIIPVVH